MFEVDRSIVILRPKLSFYNWYITLPEHSEERYLQLGEYVHSYMLEKTEVELLPSEIITDDMAHAIFEKELMLYEIDFQHWPSNRKKVDNLIEWFDIQVVPLVIDTLKSDLNKHWL